MQNSKNNHMKLFCLLEDVYLAIMDPRILMDKFQRNDKGYGGSFEKAIGSPGTNMKNCMMHNWKNSVSTVCYVILMNNNPKI